MIMRKFQSYLLILLLIISSALPTAIAQRRDGRAKTTSTSLTARGVEMISAAQLKDYLSFIASDEMEGRDTPSRGLDTTAKFLAMNLSRWGFKPAGDDGRYFQKIALSRDVIDKAETRVQINNQLLTLGDDYIPSVRSADVAAAPMIFAGNGWFVRSKSMDAYKGIDAKGKVAVIFGSPNGTPPGVRNSDLTGKRGEDWMSAGEYAQKQGVAAIVIIPDFQYLANWDRNRSRVAERGQLRVD